MVMVYIVLIILGLVLGSFVNALVWRLHEQTKKPKAKELSITKGRSMCPHCRHTLAARDLVPLFSWLSLKGKCRYCHKPIGWQYPAVELLTAALLVFSYIFWPFALTGAEQLRFSFWPLLIAGFVALVVYDLRWMLLPNRIVYFLMSFVATQWLLIWATEGLTMVQIRDIGLSVLVGGGLFYLLFQLSKGRWIGGGDVKLGFLLGLVIADPLLSWLTLFLAALLGSIVTVPLLVAGRASRKTRIPFGPFLLAGCYLVMLFGPALLDWYDRAILLK